MVEAAGVELFGVLITRKLLILGTATTAKKAPLPDPLYVYCTKMLFAVEFNRHHIAATVSHRSSGMDQKTPSFLRYPKVTAFPFLRCASLPSRLLVGWPSFVHRNASGSEPLALYYAPLWRTKMRSDEKRLQRNHHTISDVFIYVGEDGPNRMLSPRPNLPDY